ncbi:MAG TPA: 30S ribosomal protein S17 [Phycisphaeraceae bacterium]
MTAAASQTQPNSPARRLSRVKVGVVTSDKRDKTRTVVVDYQARHSKYGKYLKRQAKYQVHDPKNASKQGDLVEISPCRPISKTKAWRLVRVVREAPAAAATLATEEVSS